MIKFILLMMSLMVTFLASSQSSARYESMRLIKEGDNFLRIGNWNDALSSYTNAVSADQSFADAYMKRSMLNKKIGSNMESDADYRRALALNPYSLYIFDQRYKLDLLAIEYMAPKNEISKLENVEPIQMDHEVDNYIDIGAYKEALAIIDSLISMGFEKEFEYEKKSLVYLLNKDFETCEIFADSALTISNNSALAYDLKGLSQLMQGKLKESITSLSKAIEIDPAFSVAYLNRAVAHLHMENNDAALEDLKNSIEINQDVAMTYYLRGMLLQQKGEIEQSMTSYNSAIEIDSSYTKALFNRSFTWKMMGDFPKAMEDATLIVHLAPESPEYWNLKGNIHTLYTDYYEAIECYDQALSLKSTYPEALFNRGLAYLMSYSPARGCEDLQESKKLGYKRAEKAIFHFCGP